MSRSYRKPCITDTYGSNYRIWAKRQANKKIRRSKNVPDGKAYRKFFESWDINDYKFLAQPGHDWYIKAQRK